MQRRPPQFALPLGVVWHTARVGELRAGDPIGEWAYITPSHQDGLTTSQLRATTALEQLNVGLFWFYSNYVPFNDDGTYFGFAPHGVGFGQGPMASYWSPEAILADEFDQIIPSEPLALLGNRLKEQTERWTLRPNQPLPSPGTDGTWSRADQDELLRLFNAERAGLRRHHNQGSPLDDDFQDKADEAVELAQVANRDESSAGDKRRAKVAFQSLGYIVKEALKHLASEEVVYEAHSYFGPNLAFLYHLITLIRSFF